MIGVEEDDNQMRSCQMCGDEDGNKAGVEVVVARHRGDKAMTTRKHGGDDGGNDEASRWWRQGMRGGGRSGVTVATMADAAADGCRGRRGRCDDRRRGRGWDRIRRPIRSL